MHSFCAYLMQNSMKNMGNLNFRPGSGGGCGVCTAILVISSLGGGFNSIRLALSM